MGLTFMHFVLKNQVNPLNIPFIGKTKAKTSNDYVNILMIDCLCPMNLQQM